MCSYKTHNFKKKIKVIMTIHKFVDGCETIKNIAHWDGLIINKCLLFVFIIKANMSHSALLWFVVYPQKNWKIKKTKPNNCKQWEKKLLLLVASSRLKLKHPLLLHPSKLSNKNQDSTIFIHVASETRKFTRFFAFKFKISQRAPYVSSLNNRLKRWWKYTSGLIY